MASIKSEETVPVLKTPELHRKLLNIRYAGCIENEVVDIYLPEQGKDPFPIIVNIHGGGWYYGAKSSLRTKPVLQRLKRGHAVVSLRCTWSVHGRSPTQIYDIKVAIRYTRASASFYHVNPEKVGLWGLSAKAHLTSLVSTGAAVPQLEDLSMRNPQESSAVQCVIALYPIIDTLKLEHQHRQYGMDPSEACTNDGSMDGMLLEKAPCRVPHLCELANPENYITKDCPPFSIQHGLADAVIPFQQSILFAGKLRHMIGPGKVTSELFSQMDYAEEFFRTLENTDRIYAFFSQYLKS